MSSRESVAIACIILSILFFSVLSAAFGAEKSLSALALLPIIASAYIFARRIGDSGLDEVLLSVKFCSYIIIVTGWLAYFKLTTIGAYIDLQKPVFPFREESHFALYAASLGLILAVNTPTRSTIFITVNLILLSILFPSVTLLCGVMLILGVYMFKMKSKYMLFIAPVLLVAIGTILGYALSLDYFSSRISVNDTDNVSTLVWLQGWDLIRLNVMQHLGLGVGIQALGDKGTVLSTFSESIRSLNDQGKYQNIEDGGFLLAKISSELGLVGVLICATATVFSFRLFFSRVWVDKKNISSLSSSISIGLITEMYIRGYGYFSLGIVLFFTSFFLYIRKHKVSSACIE